MGVRSVPVGAPVEGWLLDGFIDLLFEEDGELAVVDYKTDRVTAAGIAERMEQYRIALPGFGG